MMDKLSQILNTPGGYIAIAVILIVGLALIFWPQDTTPMSRL